MLLETWASYECDGKEMDHTHNSKCYQKIFHKSKSSSSYPWKKDKVDQD